MIEVQSFNSSLAFPQFINWQQLNFSIFRELVSIPHWPFLSSSVIKVNHKKRQVKKFQFLIGLSSVHHAGTEGTNWQTGEFQFLIGLSSVHPDWYAEEEAHIQKFQFLIGLSSVHRSKD